MSNVLKPYDEYRTTGLPWLKSVPRSWSTQKAKWLFSSIDIRSQNGIEDRLSISQRRGVVRHRDPDEYKFLALQRVNRKLCWPEDLVINFLGGALTGLGFSNYHGLVLEMYGVYRLKTKSANWEYMHHLFRSQAYRQEFKSLFKGHLIPEQRLANDSFMQTPVLLPPRLDQDAIVRFIQYIDNVVDRLIQARLALIALLEEQCKVIVSVALECDNQRWERIEKLFVTVRRPADLNDFLTHSHYFRYVGSTGPSQGTSPFLGRNDIARMCLIDKGDLILNPARPSTTATSVADRVYVSSNNILCLVSISNRMSTYYLQALFRTAYGSLILRQHSFAERAPFWRIDWLLKEKVPVPTPSSLNEVNELSAKIEGLKRNLITEEKLILEYRNRLVTEIVTGQLDVRGVELPELGRADETSQGIEEENEERVQGQD